MSGPSISVRRLFRAADDRIHAFRLARAGITADFASIRKGRPVGAFGPDYFLLDALFQVTRRLRPKIVVEFGAGWSTYALTRALERQESLGHGTGHLYSIDADEQWAQVTKHGLPEELRRFCTISYSQLSIVEIGGTKAFRHDAAPDVSPDLVFVDGPKLNTEVRVACDALDYEARHKGKFDIVLDKRAPNVAFLQQNLRRNYRYEVVKSPLDRSLRVHHLHPLGDPTGSGD